MARGTLHTPKEQRHGHRSGQTHEKQTLSREPAVRGPSLESLTGSDDWSPYVRKWYETWRMAPQAVLFEDTDWQRLGMLAFGVAAYERRPGATMLGEIRMNEERLGATVVDRMRARMEIENGDEDSDSAPVVQLQAVKDDIASRLG